MVSGEGIYACGKPAGEDGAASKWEMMQACREIWAGLLDAGIGSVANDFPWCWRRQTCVWHAFQRLVRPHLHQQLENDREFVLAPPGAMTKSWKKFLTAVSVLENGAAGRIHRAAATAPRTRNYSADIALKGEMKQRSRKRKSIFW